VTLTSIKTDPNLAEIALIKQSRLSVMPLTKQEYDRILKMGEFPR
jgi:predicted RNA-binding protein with PUA-like domain